MTFTKIKFHVVRIAVYALYTKYFTLGRNTGHTVPILRQQTLSWNGSSAKQKEVWGLYR